jgi:NADPH-dependent ferric siderophore reductase
MPRVPRWVADAMESVFSGQIRKVSILEITYLNPHLKKITFKGDFSTVSFKAGQAVAIRVDDTNFRNYTPSYWDSELGIFQIVFHLHGSGPGSSYISNLQLEDTIAIGLPRGFGLYKEKHQYHFFFGDETAVGLFENLQQVIEENGQDYIGILELNNDTLNYKISTNSGLDIVPSAPEKAQSAISLFEQLPDRVWELWKNAAFYLIGNGKSIQRFRDALKDKGVNIRNIKTQPYWMEGKFGL